MNDLEREVISLSTSAQPKYDTLDQTLTGLQTNFLEYEKMYGFPFDGSPLLEVLDIGNYIGVGAIENWRHLVNDEPELFRNVISSSGNKIGAAKQTLERLHSGFEAMPDYSYYTDMYKIDSKRMLVRFVLPHSGIATLDDTAQDSRQLLGALRAIARISPNDDAYKFEVLALSQSSPEAVLLIVGAKIGLALNLILKTVFKRVGEYEEIRSLRAKTQNIMADTELKKVSKDKILKEIELLEQSATPENKSVAQEVLKECGGDTKDMDGAPAEIVKDLERAVAYVESIVNNGGVVNVYLKPGHIEATPSDPTDRKLIESRSVQTNLQAPKKLLEK